MDELELLREAVKQGIDEYLERERCSSRKQQAQMLHNVKILLENYRKLKRYEENANATLENLAKNSEGGEDIALIALEAFGLDARDGAARSIARDLATTKILVAHFERMLDVYKLQCESSPREVERRRWLILYRMYLADEAMDTKAIADSLSLDIRAVQRELNHAREDLKVLLFGASALADKVQGRPL